MRIADGAMVLDNRFCNVVTKMEAQPLASAMIQDTLTYPYPDPVLQITKSVLLGL